MRTALRTIILAIREAWNPTTALFSNSEVGVFYDVSDWANTCFQDSAGTTAAAIESPVGLILDKSQGLTLGAELVTSPYAVSGTGWASVSSSITHTGTVGVGSVTCAAPVAGKMYVVTFTASDLSGATSFVNYGSDTSNTSLQKRIATAGNYSFKLTAINNTSLKFSAYEGTDFGVTISNISVKLLPGNHATQATAASRPTLSARVNLLTKTEVFSDAVWNKVNVTISANAIAAPDGTLTADLLIDDATNAGHSIQGPSTTTTVQSYTLSVYAKSNSLSKILLYGLNADGKGVGFDLSNGTTFTAAGIPISSSYSISDAGSGWYKCSITLVGLAATAAIGGFYCVSGANYSYAGTGQSIYIWGASLVPADQASLPYQMVDTATVYDTVGFPAYLKFDGVDDFMTTADIDLTGTSKVSVFCGVRKNNDSNVMAVFDFGASGANTVGGFSAWAGNPLLGGSPVWATSLQSSAGGSPNNVISPTNFAAPDTAVVTTFLDTVNAGSYIRVDGVLQTTSAENPIDGTFGNIPLRLSRTGANGINGHLYSLIVRGAQSTDAQIVAAESYVNSKTGAY